MSILLFQRNAELAVEEVSTFIAFLPWLFPESYDYCNVMQVFLFGCSNAIRSHISSALPHHVFPLVFQYLQRRRKGKSHDFNGFYHCARARVMRNILTNHTVHAKALRRHIKYEYYIQRR
mmetsp:Transcript_17177/g.25537  ORF Transcript_17177/g.25537 Transcript_17177/m.25537 type:complete len:120 (-) Transcript_17177:2772-3131(-)